MEIGKKIVDGVGEIFLEGRLDAYSSNQVEKTINSLIDEGLVKILINFKDTDYISSSGLRVMLASLKKLKKMDGNIKLVCLKPHVLEVFEIAGFTQIFDIYEVKEEALNSFNSS